MNTVKIPQGDEKVLVQLTVKEMMALTGVQFHGNHQLKIKAKKKLQETLEDTYAIESAHKKDPIAYELLN